MRLVIQNNSHGTGQTFRNIQMLRAVAAVMVFFFHAAGHYQAIDGGLVFFNQVASVGFSGVDIFFVISGFVVAHTTLIQARTFDNARLFAQRRLLRIYLGYWPFFALTWCLAAIYEPSVLGEMQPLQSFFLMTIDAKSMVVFVSWSLTFELLCYILVSFTFAIPIQAVTRLVYILGAFILLFMIWPNDLKHSNVFAFLAFFLEFLTGMMIYIHRDKFRSRLWIAPLISITLVAFLIGKHLNATNDSSRLFTFGTGAVALLMLALVLEQSETWIANKTWVALGDASYTLYLLHPTLLTVFYFWHFRDFLALQPFLIREIGFFAYLGLSLWISKIIYVRLERPLYRWANAKCTQRG